MTSQVYQDAIEAHNTAQRVYVEVRDAYRGQTIGDDEYLKARAIMVKADDAFDIEFAAEMACGEAAEVVEDDGQLNLI